MFGVFYLKIESFFKSTDIINLLLTYSFHWLVLQIWQNVFKATTVFLYSTVLWDNMNIDQFYVQENFFRRYNQGSCNHNNLFRTRFRPYISFISFHFHLEILFGLKTIGDNLLEIAFLHFDEQTNVVAAKILGMFK